MVIEERHYTRTRAHLLRRIEKELRKNGLSQQQLADA